MLLRGGNGRGVEVKDEGTMRCHKIIMSYYTQFGWVACARVSRIPLRNEDFAKTGDTVRLESRTLRRDVPMPCRVEERFTYLAPMKCGGIKKVSKAYLFDFI